MNKKMIMEMFHENPHKFKEKFEEIYDDWAEEIEEYFSEHITNEKQYKRYVEHFENFDDTKGPHWSVEEIKEKVNINFEMKCYTCYDYAYAVNMRYSDDGDLMSAENIFKSAKRYLEDKDSGIKDPSTRAYHDGKQRHLRFMKKD